MKVRSNLPGLGFNVSRGQADVHDARIHDVGDSAILLHGTQQSGVVRRVEISRVLQAVAWATHGIYAKSPGNLLEDIRIDNTGGQASSGITLRMRNQTLRRVWIGGGFSHPLTYYEHDGQGGVVLVEDAELHCTNTQTCIWGDDGNAPPTPGLKQQFTFRRVHVFGSGGHEVPQLHELHRPRHRARVLLHQRTPGHGGRHRKRYPREQGDDPTLSGWLVEAKALPMLDMGCLLIEHV